MIFTLLIGLTLYANVMCVFRSTFLMMWGPRRALMADREPDAPTTAAQRWRGKREWDFEKAQ